MPKTLNEHLFDTLDRLSNCDAENLETEMNKANSIISVAEKVLDVARLKLEIIGSIGNIGLENFSDVDNLQKQLEDPDKKKD